jgi:hypothetical protein
MRNPVNLRPLSAVLCLLAAVLIFLHSCRRQDGLITRPPLNLNKETVRAWLLKNGENFKNEMIAVDAPNGKEIARLDWSRAKQVNWRGKSYIDVPYIFGTGSKFLPAESNMEAASFSLVIRGYRNGAFRAALRTVAYDANDSKKAIQTYKFLNGASGNAWYSDSKHQIPIAAHKTRISDQARTIPRGVSYRDSANCVIQTTTTYSGNCNYSIGEMVYVTLCPHVEQMAICPPENTEGDENNNPSGPPGGTNPKPNPNPNPTQEPPTECSDEPPPPPPPPNPDGTEFPDTSLPPCEDFPPEEDNSRPGDLLCKHSLEFSKSTDKSHFLTRISGLRFENTKTQFNNVGLTYVGLTNQITAKAMGTAVSKNDDYFAQGENALYYVKTVFPELFTSKDITITTNSLGESVYQYSEYAAATIATYSLNFAGEITAMQWGHGAAAPNNEMAWVDFWSMANQLVRSFMPGSTVRESRTGDQGTISNASYSRTCGQR